MNASRTTANRQHCHYGVHISNMMTTASALQCPLLESRLMPVGIPEHSSAQPGSAPCTGVFACRSGGVPHMLSNDSIRMDNGCALLLGRPAIVTMPWSYFLPSLAQLAQDA